MTVLSHPSAVSIADYLAGEDGADGKHEYLGGFIHAMAGGTSRHNPISINAVIQLPEIAAELPLAELYERITF